MTKWKQMITYLNAMVGKSLSLIDIEVDLNMINTKMISRYKAKLTNLGYVKMLSNKTYKVIKKIPITLTVDGELTL